MKNLRVLIVSALLSTAGVAYAQTSPVPGGTSPQTVPQQDPATTSPGVEKRTDFNAPQSPTRPANIPSEDTLIKSQRTSGAVIQDTLTPSSNKKKDKADRKKNRTGNADMGDTTSTNSSSNRTTTP